MRIFYFSSFLNLTESLQGDSVVQRRLALHFSDMKNDPTGAFFCVKKVRPADRRSS